MPYRHVQWGWTWLLYLIFALVVGGIAVAAVGESGDAESAWVIAFTVALLIAIFVIVLLFSRLEVTVVSENATEALGFDGWSVLGPLKLLEASGRRMLARSRTTTCLQRERWQWSTSRQSAKVGFGRLLVDRTPQ